MQSAARPEPAVQGAIDRFSIFRDAVNIVGWCVSTAAPIVALEIRASDLPDHLAGRRISPVWLPSADIAAVFGPHTCQARFDVTVVVGPHAGQLCGGRLAAILEDGSPHQICKLGLYRPSAASDLAERFFNALGQMHRPSVLEVGARARSGITRNDRLPQDARYVGCDILAGDNVDVVCDAHALSHHLPGGSFDAVMAFSVLEHLLMPWKFVLELNKVMATGAIGLFTTHQAWPIHDAPWDYWRFSDRAWTGLLNPGTGFAIIGAAMGEPAYLVAADTHPVTSFGAEPNGFLASNVLFRKITETDLHWDVDAANLVASAYPA